MSSFSLTDSATLLPRAVDPQQNNGHMITAGRTLHIKSSKKTSVFLIDSLFNFQLVVFEAGGTLFQVVKNDFNVPGTIFEAMFALPVLTPQSDVKNVAVEGNTLDNPIHLAGITAEDFRAFLRIIHPFIGPSVPLTYAEWVGVLKLSTMWDFQEIREKAISNLSPLIAGKSALERISLGRTYRVYGWLRVEYMRLAQKASLRLDELRNSSGIFLDWETIARILSVRDQSNLRNLQASHTDSATRCPQCCQLLSVVDSVFKEEYEEEMKKLPKDEGFGVPCQWPSPAVTFRYW